MTPQSGPGFRITPQAVFGLVIIIAGLLMTADNLQWLETSRILRFWPLGVIVAGALKFAQSPASSGRLFGGLIMFVGMMLTAEHTLGWNIEVEDWWLPVGLIGIGVLVILRAQNLPAQKPPKVAGDAPAGSGQSGPFFSVEAGFGASSAASSDSSISEVAIWAGKQRRVTSPMFKRGDLTAIMGGIELDLRGAGTSAVGGESVIDLFVMWGGIEIWVPPDWAVSNEVGVLMAGCEDKSTGTQAARHRLTVRGFAIMGGVEIKT